MVLKDWLMKCCYYIIIVKLNKVHAKKALILQV